MKPISHIAESIYQDTVARRLVSGMVEPPPAMVDQIYKWTKAQMAAGRAVNDMNAIEATKQDIQRHSQLLKEAHQQNDNEAIDFEMNRIATLEDYLEKEKTRLEATLEEVKLFPRVSVKRWNRAKRSFKVDMRGWKYLPLLKKAEQKNIDYANELWGKITAGASGSTRSMICCSRC